jgi:hypothetical protein
MTKTSAITDSVWTRFFFDASHECNLFVSIANDLFYGTEIILFRIEATVSLLTPLGQLNYVIVNNAYHKNSYPANELWLPRIL